MDLKQKLEEELIKAMKTGDSLTRDVIRGLKTSISNWQISQLKDATNEDIIAIIKSAIKQRQDSKEQFINANRQELADKEQKEAEILAHYLPEQLSEEEVNKAIEECLKKYSPEIKNMGAIMNELRLSIGAKADMGKVASIVKSKLA